MNVKTNTNFKFFLVLNAHCVSVLQEFVIGFVKFQCTVLVKLLDFSGVNAQELWAGRQNLSTMLPGDHVFAS